ncbi:hypothetical protein QTG54_006915 [Skeletonema marinoi]|uniref:Uncharacterized protein n=1 Tax=Skeletonema marinoi TaxID=267567 RepID=A0AAD9DE32_9STRA|nr:hypothetical protein QTG54_006915 [Skeletonema marinoi]
MQVSKSPKRYDTSHTIIYDESSQAAAIDAKVLLHRLRGGDEANDESAVEEDDNDSSNDVSATSPSEPITVAVDDSVVETDNEEADEDDFADDINIVEAVNIQEEGSVEEVEGKIIDDETNNFEDNAAVLATEEVEETTTATASDEADMEENENDHYEETVELVEEEASDDEQDIETEGSASEPSISDTMANTTPASVSESNTDNDYDDDNDAYDDTDSTDEETATTTTTTTTSPPDTYEVQSNELRTSASYKRAMAKTHHDNGNLKDASIAFREAAMLLDEAMEALSQSSSINDNDTKEEEEGNIAVERATCRLHEALCLLKDGRPGDCVEACTDVLEDDVTVVPLDNQSENGDDGADDDASEQPTQAAVVKIIPATTTTGASNKPAIPAQIRARAHHRRAKARLALGDLDGALEDARSAAFMGDRNAVQFYGRLMREGSATTTGAELSSSPSSPMGMGGGSNPFLDGMLGGMGGNTNPFMPSPGAGSSSDFSSSLLSSLLTGSSGSGSGGGGNPFGLMGELLSPPEESTGSSKRRRGKAKKDSLAKSVLKNIMKRIEDEETQETICGYLQSTNKQQIMQFSTMAGVPIKEETAQRLSGLANGITPKGIRKGVRRVKRGLKVVKTGRKILKVIDKYKPVIIVAVLLYWVRSAILEPYPISKKKKLAQQAALGLLITPTHKSALTNVRGALSKVFMSPAEADAGIVEDDSSSSGIEEELEKLQHQLTLIEAIEERNKAQIYSFIDEEDQWNSMEEWEQELLSSKEALTQRMEQMTEELVLMFMGEKAKNG